MKETLVAAGGAVSALAASTCCVIPISLAAAGAGGAWIGTITALAPYQPVFLATSVVLLSAGFWFVYRRSGEACAAGACGDAARRVFKRLLLVKSVLWIGAVLVGLSVGLDFGARLVF